MHRPDEALSLRRRLEPFAQNAVLVRQLESQVRQIRRLSVPPQALGVGGSVGAGIHDEYSDLDLFIFYSDVDVLPAIKTFPIEAAILFPEVIAIGQLAFSQDFGFRYTCVSQEGSYVEYYLVSPSLLTHHPLRRKTHILFDRTGTFLRFFDNLSASEDRGSALVDIRLFLTDVIVELASLRKSAMRRTLLPLIYRLDRLRLLIIAIETAQWTQSRYSPVGADKSLDLMPNEYIDSLLKTVPTPDWTSIRKTFAALQTRIEDAVQRAGLVDNQNGLLMQLEMLLTRQIAKALTAGA